MLGNAFRAVPEQTKTAICCEWFKCVSPPVVIDIAAHGGAPLALKTIIKVLQRVEIAPNELVICNRLGWNRMVPTGALSYDAILKRWEDESRPLGASVLLNSSRSMISTNILAPPLHPLSAVTAF